MGEGEHRQPRASPSIGLPTISNRLIFVSEGGGGEYRGELYIGDSKGKREQTGQSSFFFLFLKFVLHKLYPLKRH